MDTPLIHPLLKRRFAWLLWLALLLPLAQSAASWHVYSHSNPVRTGEPPVKDFLHASHCDLCLAAAALIGGAAPATTVAMPQALAGHEVLRSGPVGSWIAAASRPYQSRAPPSP